MISVIQNIQKDIQNLIANNDKLTDSPGVYLIYIDCSNSEDIYPYTIETSKRMSRHFSTFKSRLKSYMTTSPDDDNDIDNVVLKRFAKFLQEHNLSIDSLKSVVLSCLTDQSSDVSVVESYWSRRLLSDMTSYGHSLFVKNLRRFENKILFSKDNESTRDVLTKMLNTIYKNGLDYLDVVFNFSKIYNYGYAKDNWKTFLVYLTERLTFAEDDDIVDMTSLRQTREKFYKISKIVFNL